MQVTFVMGPTAAGKSDWALDQAEACGGVIINCDSVQSYAHVQIGAAKPSAQDLARVPHFLYGYIEPFHELTAGEHRRAIIETIEKERNNGVTAFFVVGGTGFYFQALEKGMFDLPQKVPVAVTASLEADVKTLGLLKLHQELQAKDPLAAAKIHPNDQYRIFRALEILRATNEKPSELARRKKEEGLKMDAFPYPLKKVAIHCDRALLHQRIAQRTKKMLQQGFIEEVEDLIQRGYQNWAPLQSVGYKEVQAFLKGEISSLAELEEKIIISTRQLAKRQITWFKRDPEIHWLSLFETP